MEMEQTWYEPSLGGNGRIHGELVVVRGGLLGGRTTPGQPWIHTRRPPLPSTDRHLGRGNREYTKTKKRVVRTRIKRPPGCVLTRPKTPARMPARRTLSERLDIDEFRHLHEKRYLSCKRGLKSMSFRKW